MVEELGGGRLREPPPYLPQSGTGSASGGQRPDGDRPSRGGQGPAMAKGKILRFGDFAQDDKITCGAVCRVSD